MKTKTYITNSITVVLLALWIPICLYQVLHFDAFQIGILRQPLNDVIAWTLIYTLPVLEILTVILLITDRFRRLGLLLSSIWMAAFTGYVGLALLGAWGKLPCGCGLIISGISWMQHFWFNLFFLAISIIGWVMHQRQQYSIDDGQVPSAISHRP